MNEIKLHINTAGKTEDNSAALFARMEIPWEKSKSQVWQELSAKIDAMPTTKQRRVIPMFYGLSAAAVIIILLAVTIFLRLYSTTISSLSGENMTAQLPDGSSIELHAGSSLTYHPYWWQFSRKVNFEGEGFFKVEKGKKFEVASPLAKTIVLGTSFTIYSRNDEYRVSCFTGRVKVVSLKDGNVVLEPNERAVVGIDGSIVKHINHRNEPSNEKSDGNFIFTGASLSQVIDEIGRRYSVSITLKIEKEYFYTGNFTSEKPLNDVLDLVCKPFSLSFAKQADGSYMVFQNK
jgi:ferric-dicitrate binding protein FerR (iron transport regulator)